MKKVNVYAMYMDDGRDCFKVVVPATSEKEAREYVLGNGEVVAVKKMDDIRISTEKLADDLLKAGWGRTEVDVITRLLSQVDLSL